MRTLEEGTASAGEATSVNRAGVHARREDAGKLSVARGGERRRGGIDMSPAEGELPLHPSPPILLAEHGRFVADASLTSMAVKGIGGEGRRKSRNFLSENSNSDSNRQLEGLDLSPAHKSTHPSFWIRSGFLELQHAESWPWGGGAADHSRLDFGC